MAELALEVGLSDLTHLGEVQTFQEREPASLLLETHAFADRSNSDTFRAMKSKEKGFLNRGVSC